MKKMLIALFLLAGTVAQAQTWQAVGIDDNDQVSPKGSFLMRMFADTLGGAYVSYVNIEYNGVKWVMNKETPTGWVELTSFIMTHPSYSFAMDKSGNLYYTYASFNTATSQNTITSQKFNGVNWSQLGAPYVTSDSVSKMTISINPSGVPYILYSGSVLPYTNKMIKWDGSNWLNVGNTIATTTSTGNALFDFDNTGAVYVLYTDAANNDSAQVKTFDGTNWVKYGFAINQNCNVGSRGFKIYNDTFFLTKAGCGYVFNNNTFSPIGNSSYYVNNPPSSLLSFFSSDTATVIHPDTTYSVHLLEDWNYKIQLTKKANGVVYYKSPLGIEPPGHAYYAAYATTVAPPFENEQHKLFVDKKNNTVGLFATKYYDTITHMQGAFMKLTNNNWEFVNDYQPSTQLYNFYFLGLDTAGDFYAIRTVPSSSGSLPYMIFYHLVGQQWQSYYSPFVNVSNNAFRYGTFVFDKNNTPYVGYVDASSLGASRVSVRRFNGAAWVDVDLNTPYVSASISDNPIVIFDSLDNINVLYRDTIKNLYLQNFNGTQWDTVGAAIASNAAAEYAIALKSNGNPVVALKQFSNNRITVKEFDGTNWNTLGIAGFSYGTINHPKIIVVNDTPIVAYADETLKRVIVAKYNGANWGALGTTDISKYSSSYPNLLYYGNEIYLSYYSDGLFAKKNISNTIVPLFACDTPSITVSSITDTNAAASWTHLPQALGSEYVLSTSNTPPTSSGIFVANGHKILSGLQPNTTYYLYVRNLCGIDTSSWILTSFTTTNLASTQDINAAQTDLKIYPNPVTNILNIEQQNTVTPQYLELYDLLGRIVRTIQFASKTIHVDLNNLPSGVYLLKNKTLKNSDTYKIIKQ